MSRAGYNDDCGGWDLICYRGAVTSAMRGKRGQAFLRELLASLDSLPEKKLIAGALKADGAFCALGSVAHARGLSPEKLALIEQGMEYEDGDVVANEFGINEKLAREIMWVNDESVWPKWDKKETPDELATRRFAAVRDWAEKHLIEWDAPQAAISEQHP